MLGCRADVIMGEMSKRFELPPLFWGCLLLILLGTMFLRAYQLDWGLPSYYVPDEAVFTAETAERILSGH